MKKRRSEYWGYIWNGVYEGVGTILLETGLIVVMVTALLMRSKWVLVVGMIIWVLLFPAYFMLGRYLERRGIIKVPRVYFGWVRKIFRG
jgi:hypothetical protein